MFYIKYFLVLILFSCFSDPNRIVKNNINCKDVKDIDEGQCNAIIDIADYAGYNIQNKNKICEGNSIFCKDNKITKIYWEHEDLNGTIHASINKLTSLKYLSLNGNKLKNNIPDLSELKNLERLDLSNNKLTGDISNITKLENLEHLYLSNNKLTGDISNITKLKNLNYLYLSDNKLTGDISNITKLESLDYLYLSDNKLTGDISNITKLESLDYLDLSKNKLTGDISNIISNITKLESLDYLDLSNNNELTGDISNISQLTDLYHLDLSNNDKLKGNISADLIKQLIYLNISNNKYITIDKIVTNNINCKKVIDLNEDQCNVIVDIADYAGYNIQNKNKICEENGIECKNKDITKIYWYRKSLEGTIHSSINKLTNLQSLHISSAFMKGNIPDLSNLKNLKKLNLSYNVLTGNIPDLSNLKSLVILNLSSNKLKGNIPDLNNLTNLYSLQS